MSDLDKIGPIKPQNYGIRNILDMRNLDSKFESAWNSILPNKPMGDKKATANELSTFMKLIIKA